MNCKVCSDCGQTKLLSEFNKDKTRLSGYAYKCKSCHQQHINNFHNSWGAGIYQVINKITQDSYIGQSTQLRRRKVEHWTLSKPKGVASPLLNANMKKYGKQNFEFIKLENCSVDKLEELERKYIQIYKPTLNDR